MMDRVGSAMDRVGSTMDCIGPAISRLFLIPTCWCRQSKKLAGGLYQRESTMETHLCSGEIKAQLVILFLL